MKFRRSQILKSLPLFCLLLNWFAGHGQLKDGGADPVRLSAPGRKSVTIKGNIRRFTTDSSLIDRFTFQYRDMLTGKNVIFPIDKDSAGNFTTTIPLNDVRQIFLGHSSKHGNYIYDEGLIELFFFARPGEIMDLNYYLDKDFKVRTLHFKGSRFATLNNQYQAYQKELDHSEFSQVFDYNKLDSVKPENYAAFKAELSARLEAALDFNRKYFAAVKADKFVREQADAEMRYDIATVLLQPLLRLSIRDTLLTDFFKANHIVLNNPEFYGTGRYASFLDQYYLYIRRGLLQNEKTRTITFPQIGSFLLQTHPDLSEAHRLLAGKMKDTLVELSDGEKKRAMNELLHPYAGEYLAAGDTKIVFDHLCKIEDEFLSALYLTRYLTESMKDDGVATVTPLLDAYNTAVRSKPLKLDFMEQYQVEYDKAFKSKLLPGSVLNSAKEFSADAAFTGILDKYKGKIIYVDVWATWCQPCLAEMANSASLRQKFNGKNVAFVYLCINSPGENLWKNKIASHQIEGEHYFLDKQQSESLIKGYGIKGIPRYMIIDQDGQIINQEATRPGDSKTFKDLNTLLISR